MSVISYPTPLFQNVAITTTFKPQHYQISAITTGVTTTITTTVAHDYVIGQQVRLIIPVDYGSRQLNNVLAYVVSIPSTTEVLLELSSLDVDAFIVAPYTATITGASQAVECVITCNNSFSNGNLTITDVEGMTELNVANIPILRGTATTVTLDINSALFTAYTGAGTATLQQNYKPLPQILGIGDINSGPTNTNNTSNTLYIDGSFRNTSP